MKVFLDPYNDHIILAPLSIYKALLAAFGMSSALPFQIVSILVFLLSVVLLFIYLRSRVGDWLALLGVILILFLGAGWNTLLWPFRSGSLARSRRGSGLCWRSTATIARATWSPARCSSYPPPSPSLGLCSR